METIFDWVTIAIFAGLIVLFLQRSTESEPRDSIWQYLGASVGCAVANWLGNNGYQLLAVIAIAATLGYVWYALRPFEGWPKS